MDSLTILLILGAFFIASFLKGLSGLGFSTICLGMLALFLDMKLAIPLVFLPSLSSNIMLMIESGHFFESIKRFWVLYLSAVPGLVIGIIYLNYSNGDGPKVILGITMLLYGIWALRNDIASLSKKWETRLLFPIGIVSGMVNGATGSQIMPIMPYLMSVKLNRELFIQTINCAFTFNTLIMMVGLGSLGLLTRPVLTLSIVGILPVALGIYLGGRIRRRTTDTTFRKGVLSLLILMGLALLARLFIN